MKELNATYQLSPGLFFYWNGQNYIVGSADRPFYTCTVDADIGQVLIAFRHPITIAFAYRIFGGNPGSSKKFGRALDFFIRHRLIVPAETKAQKIYARRRQNRDPSLRNFSGLDIARLQNRYPDLSRSAPRFLKDYEFCRPYSFASVPMAYALYNSMNYVLDSKLAGDVVECGVWRGGSAMLCALVMKRRRERRRKIHLFDVFDGTWDAPSRRDRLVYDGNGAVPPRSGGRLMQDREISAGVGLQSVAVNLRKTSLAESQLVFHKGLVQETLPAEAPEKIALLRLDTDFYDSTFHTLRHLYPRLVPGGVLIIDDYGKFSGATEASDDYFRKNKIQILLNRIDSQGRIAIKC